MTLPVPYDERQQEQRSRAKHSRVISLLNAAQITLISVCNMCAVRRRVFTLPLGEIDRPCSAIVALPDHRLTTIKIVPRDQF